MRHIRIIPVLLYRDEGLWKGEKFASHRYLGDPFNAMRIFRLYNVDELVFIDIAATERGQSIDPVLVETLAKECSMPLAVGGGISSLDQASELMARGAEKIILNSHYHDNPDLITQIADKYGSQAVVACIETLREGDKFQAYSRASKQTLTDSPSQIAVHAQDLGAGEILLNSIDRDGGGDGFDCRGVTEISNAVGLPIIALGGAGNLSHLLEVAEAGASAAACGSLFVFFGRRKGVLVHYPRVEDLDTLFDDYVDPVFVDPDFQSSNQA